MKLKPGTPLGITLAFSPSNRKSVGRLALDRGRGVLEYDPAFIAAGLTINPFLPEPSSALAWAKDPTLFDGVHAIFADSLPDAWGDLLVRRRAEREHIDYASLTALDKLAIVGSRGMGALVYEPAVQSADIDAIDLDGLATQSLAVIEGRDVAVLAQLERLGGSSGGARPKVLVAMNSAGHVVAGDSIAPPGYEAWLVKFRGSRHDVSDIGPLEAAYADMARAAGLDIAPTRLISSSRGPGYFATRRFDRGPNGERNHMASVCALLDTEWTTPTIDYDGLFRVTRKMTRDQQAVDRMFLRMVFNVVAHNRDDHTKQHAFLMDANGMWTPAPAYDLTFSRGPGGEHYLGVGGYGGDDITVDAMIDLGVAHGVDKRRGKEIVDSVCDAVSAFPTFARSYGVTAATLRGTAAVLDAGLTRLLHRSVQGFSQDELAAGSDVTPLSDEELRRQER